MSGAARRGPGSVQLRAGRGANLPAAASGAGGGGPQVAAAANARAHLPAARGHEAGSVALCAHLCKTLNQSSILINRPINK